MTNEETYAETRAREAGEEAREQAYADLHDEFEALYEAADLRTKASDGYSLEDVIECETDGMDEIYKALMSDDARDALVKKCIHLHCMKGVENVSSR